MKRKLAFIFLILVLSAIGYFGISIYNSFQQKKTVKKRIAVLPKFLIEDFKGGLADSRSLSIEVPLILNYFNTDCEFCQAEIKSIRKHRPLQENAKVFLISSERKDVLKKFSREFELDSLKSISILQDSTKKIKELFGIKGVPTTFIYNREKELVKKFEGETKAQVLNEWVK